MQKRRIVITGATGVIGSALTKLAVEHEFQVLCLIRKNSDRMKNLLQSDRIKIAYCDVDEYQCFPNGEERYDLFYHFAWDGTFGASRDNLEVQLANIQYTLNAVRLAKRLGCKKFIGVGSQAEYGMATKALQSQTPVDPQSAYAVAKYAAGKSSGILCTQLDMQFNWVRVVSVFGPTDRTDTLLMYVIRELEEGRSPKLTKCEQIWDYLYCEDSARAFLAIGEKGVNGKIYPLGSGECHVLSEYVELVKNRISPDIKIKYGAREYQPHQPMYLCADISELTHDTDWKPILSFEEGVELQLNEKWKGSDPLRNNR